MQTLTLIAFYLALAFPPTDSPTCDSIEESGKTAVREEPTPSLNTTAAEIYYFHTDHLGSSAWITDSLGQALYVDLSKIDLSGVFSLGENFVGKNKVVNLLYDSNSLNDGLVYGKITLKRYPNHNVKAYSDTYNFDMKPWGNPLNWGRNIETIIGQKYAGEGVPYEINIYGMKQLTPILPCIK